VASDGSVIAGGVREDFSSAGAYQHIIAFKLTGANGSPVTSFGVGGKLVDSVAGYRTDAQVMSVQSDGKIVFGGTKYDAQNNASSYIMRTDANGVRDLSFNTTGTHDFSYGNQGGSMNDFEILSDGSILALSIGVAATGTEWATLYKLNSNGTPSTNFNDTSYFRYIPEFSVISGIGGIAVQQDGKILLGNTQVNSSFTVFESKLARFGSSPARVSEQDPAALIAITPNPAQQSINIIGKGYADTKLTICDAAGKVVSRTTVQHTATIDVSNLPRGTYYVKAVCAQQVQSSVLVLD
jgi:hypothetical protein